MLHRHDQGRTGGIRYYDPDSKKYHSDEEILAVPPMEQLRKLEDYAVRFDSNEKGSDKWLDNLVAPGSSLGGARPKANVSDESGNVWIAKFPSKKDDINVGAWEMVAHDLAALCGIDVPAARLMRFSETGDTFLVRRFDRNGDNRFHFASAMTMLGQTDDSEEQSGYLDLAGIIEQICSNPEADLFEMWKRLVFNICISNADDHLRNHGFLLRKDEWSLSPAFDLNPSIETDHLSLLVGESDRKDLSEAVRIAGYFRVNKDAALKTSEKIYSTVKKKWKELASKYRITGHEQKIMESAFSQAGKSF